MPRLSSLAAVLAIVVFALFGTAGSALAAQPLVDAAWLRQNGDKPNVVILDVRNKLGKGSEKVYRAGHIPGSIYSDYLRAGWRTKMDGVVGQLPPVAALEKLIGGLGIGNGSHVVVVAGGVSALDMGSATRIYWTFKVLGHDEVSVLDGGYRAYAAEPGNPVETGRNTLSPTTFKASFRPRGRR
jgi:thiosulfate/3-mercaptopyruvate sulfurtransferase